MGRFRTFTILLTLVAWGSATEGVRADDPAPAGASTRPQPPVPPGQYVRAGIQLYTKGDVANAAKYFKAAGMYRDLLSADDQAQLDAYLARMNPAPAPADPAVSPARGLAPAAVSPAGVDRSVPQGPRSGTTDTKQQGRWLLQSAREQARLGHYDEAEKFTAQAEGLGVTWGLFDDTPAKVRADVAKFRPKLSGDVAATNSGPHDRREARARLKEGRAALAAGQFEQAEAIALEVRAWGQTFSMLEDNPDKLASAARALRRREATRNAPLKNQPSPAIYEILVQQARSLMAAGKLDEAELKAREAMKLSVVPSLMSDRAETVLHDVAMAKARKPGASPTAESASATAEREANELLAKDDSQAALAKFAEAERARLREMKSASGTVDLAVRPTSAQEPFPLPAPAPAAGASPAAAPLEPLPAADMPAPAPLPEAMPSPRPVDPPAAVGNRGTELLAQAKALYSQGNYPAAKQAVAQARAGQFGVEAQADELLASIALSEQGGALSVYEAALDALRKNDNKRARDLLTEVQAAGSALDEGIQKKVDDLLARLPKDDKAPAGRAIAADLMNDVQAVEAQRLNIEVGSKLNEARRWLETDPDKSIAILNEALASVKAKDLPPTVARTLTRRIEVGIELAKKDKATFDVKIQDKTVKAEIESKKVRILEADKAKKEQIKALMVQAEKAYAEQRLEEAETLARRAQEIDPDEVGPGLLAYKSNLERHFRQAKDIEKRTQEGALEALSAADEAGVIPKEIARGKDIIYANSFSDLTRSRMEMNARLEDKKTPATANIEKKLNEPISINMKEQSLDEAITFVQNYTGLNVVLDPRALQEEGLSRDSKVTLNVNNLKLKSALKLLLRPLGLTYKVEDDVLMITSPQATAATTYVKTYPVADLVIGPNRTGQGNQPKVVNANGQGPAGPDLADISGAANGDLSGFGRLVNSTVGPAPKVDLVPLVQLITNSIAPGTWKVLDEQGKESADAAYGMGGGFGGDAGGIPGPPVGAIIPFNLSISLIIRQTAEVHEDIADLLRQLRRLQDLQVSIEVRFIDVTDDFFEQISVDFDFNIESKAIGKHSTFAVQNPNLSLFGTTAGTTTAGTAGTTGGGTTGGGTTGGGTTGGGTTGGGSSGIGGGGLGGGGGATTGLGGSSSGGSSGSSSGTTSQVYLVNPLRENSLGNRLPVTVGLANPGIGNFTTDLGIPFSQGPYSTLIAPFNAVPGAGGTFGISFLSDLEVYLFLTAAQGDTRANIVQAPKITTFNGAQAFILNASVRYYVASLQPIVGFGAVAFQPTPAPLNDGVTLSVTPVVSADRRYVRMTLTPNFNVVTGLSTFQIPAAVGGGGLGGQATSINGQIQLPETTTTILSTTVTVPDGGTVLLGGVKRMREERKEYGVPLLNKTPWIDRLFRNVGIGRRTDSLMMMVTPRIIILEEEEARLGIPPVQ